MSGCKLSREEIVRRRKQGGYDEIIFMGHSLGCALKLDVVDRVMRIEAGSGPAGETFNMLSAGSSLLKIALHPAGAWLKEAVARVSQHKAVFWVDFQSMVDIISFYKVDPVKALGLPETGQPIIKRVHVRDMLQRETYRRFSGNFFRLHRQLVMGNDKRYFYDYFMVCCGPFRFATRLRDPELMTAAIRCGWQPSTRAPNNERRPAHDSLSRKTDPGRRRGVLVRDPAAASAPVMENGSREKRAHHAREIAADLLGDRAWTDSADLHRHRPAALCELSVPADPGLARRCWFSLARSGCSTGCTGNSAAIGRIRSKSGKVTHS